MAVKVVMYNEEYNYRRKGEGCDSKYTCTCTQFCILTVVGGCVGGHEQGVIVIIYERIGEGI